MAHLMEQQFGNYRLIRLLGQGGFADVYLGEHVHLNTLAAIKILRAQLIADEITNFRTEARTIAHLAHPNIVRVLDFDVQGTIPFLVMDYAPNGNLRQFHPQRVPLPPQVVVSYIKQVAAALGYAHNRRLIHRDIKPENMLLGQNREVLLSDFGIALVTEGILAQSQRNSASDAAGTAVYMAPEQQQGHPSPASDQYALGVVAYEWLCGVRPFNGTYIEVAIQHMQAPPPSMREILPTISPDIEKVVFTALAKDPQRRFRSVQAFANALEQACQEEATYLVSADPNRSQHPAGKEEQTMEITLHGPFGRKVLGPTPLTIGQGQDNQLVIADPKVSARHAEIRPTGQGYAIADSGSTNGTYVNGQWLTRGVPRMLQQGDTIRMGDTTITYVLSSAQPSRNIPPGGSTQRADYAYPPVNNPYQSASNPYQQTPLAPPHTGYGWGAQQQQAPAAPPPPVPTPAYIRSSHMSVQQPVSVPQRTIPDLGQKKSLPRLWIVIGIVVAMLVFGGVGTFAYINSLSTPTKTLDMFCADLQSKDYPSAYNLTSAGYQGKQSISQFTTAFSPYTSCTYSSVNTSNGNMLATITFASAPWDYQASLLKDSNGSWTINDIVALPDLTLNTFCNDIQGQNYPAAYGLTSGSYQTNDPESQFAQVVSTYTSCTHSPAETSSGKTTATIIFGNAPWDYQAPLLKDSSGTWKIGDFVGFPDLTLNTFCDDIQKQDYQAAYGLTSLKYQQAVQSEPDFVKALSTYMSCTHSSVATSNGSATATLMFTPNNWDYQASLLKDSNGAWKIDSFAALPDLTLATFCDDVQKQDYPAAYGLTSGSYHTNVPESRLAGVLALATSCTFQHVSVTSSGNVQGGITLGFSDGSSIHFTVPLIKDSNGDWKIDNFIKS